MKERVGLLVLLIGLVLACQKESSSSQKDAYPAIQSTFQGKIDPQSPDDYAGQEVPLYITKDNTDGNVITNAGATLGRVLFYDRKLSIDNSISCSSCHKQEFAFGDDERLSGGVAGETGRHSMRLVNARFGFEKHFFWDERAATLEEQVTQPIQDHVEMGFSGRNGHPGIKELLTKLGQEDYYQELFTWVFGDAQITEERLKIALSQFVRSIQSFDSKYDQARNQGYVDGELFPNYTKLENDGKRLFTFPLGVGGAGCAGCHIPPEFDINANSGNNGVIRHASDSSQLELFITRSPSLRDLVKQDGSLNGPMMHTGNFSSLAQVIEHYNDIPNDPANSNLAQQLKRPGNQTQDLELTFYQKQALMAFIKTLAGSNIYTEPMYSDPFPQ